MSADDKTFTGAAAQLPRQLLGEIFVRQGLLAEVSVQRLVEHAKKKNIRLGTLLEVIGLVTPEELAEALSIQYRCRKVMDFAKYHYSEQLLRIIPLESAVKHAIFPLKLENGRLGLAVADPTTGQLFREISGRHNLDIIPFVSTRTEINRAIAKHYLGQQMAEAGDKTILLVEDDNLVRDMVSKILTRHGYEVETAVDGMDAFNKIFTFRPKLVITDKEMPKLNGYDFLFSIKSFPEFRFTPVILMTAAASPAEEKEALEKGFFDFILKPVREIGLLTRVRRAFLSAEILYAHTGS
jgi:CheY-like chemotaxis protein